MGNLEKERKKIDGIDSKIVSLLDERARFAKLIGKKKREAGETEVIQTSREREVIRKVSGKAKLLPKGDVASIYAQIISVCRGLQKKVRVGYLGPEGTYSHIAALSYFGQKTELISHRTISAAFASFEEGEVSLIIVPVENSSGGSVGETLDNLYRANGYIIGEVVVPIRHCLLAKKGVMLGRVKLVIAHPNALLQCSKFIERNKFSTQDCASTAAACRKLDGQSASIGSELAAELFGLEILKRNIGDYEDNTTRFIIVGRSPCSKTGKDKTSLLFTLPHKPGTLYQTLGVFARDKINLLKVESRPYKGRKWEYLFFVDFEGHECEPKVERVLKRIRKISESLRVLGSYPAD